MKYSFAALLLCGCATVNEKPVVVHPSVTPDAALRHTQDVAIVQQERVEAHHSAQDTKQGVLHPNQQEVFLLPPLREYWLSISLSPFDKDVDCNILHHNPHGEGWVFLFPAGTSCAAHWRISANENVPEKLAQAKVWLVNNGSNDVEYRVVVTQ
jgi:hypothetical protein